MSSDLTLAVVDGEPRVDSRIVATGLGVEHKATMQLIDKYSEQFQEFGQLPFEMEVVNGHQGGGNPAKFTLLNEDQAYFLMTLVRNTPQAVELKKRLVRAFAEARRIAQGGSTTPSPSIRAERELQALARETMRTLKTFGIVGNAAVISTDNYCRNLCGRSLLAALDATHLLADPRGRTYTPTELGKMCTPPLSAIKLNFELERAGLQKRDMGEWMPTDKATHLCEWLDTGKRHSSGAPVKQLRWFKQVLGHLPSHAA